MNDCKPLRKYYYKPSIKCIIPVINPQWKPNLNIQPKNYPKNFRF